MPADREHLRRLAEGARDVQRRYDAYPGQLSDEDRETLQRFAIACGPDGALDLLDTIDALEAERDELRGDDLDQFTRSEWKQLVAELSAARAEVERLREALRGVIDAWNDPRTDLTQTMERLTQEAI